MMRATFAALLLIAAPVTACAQQPPAPPSTPPRGNVINCTDPRPQVCTRDYRPVCGTRRDGTRQTYDNACGACADANVVSHIPGPCS